ncbi:hypothetical protein ACERK3_05260 [Phycisphaerales bacterium AB-hyl4]|uniref:Uncharacterized protein n=1 Tax=Natronomicrosphaera hydrolytica TaxID=3242702 RepID=A0ABV4U3F2_9BACT
MAGESLSSERAVRIVRIVWVGLLVVQLFFGMGAVWFVSYRPAPEPAEGHPWGLYAVGAVLLIVLAVGGYLVRRRLYERGRLDDGAVAAEGYLRGNLVLLVPMAVMGVAGMGLAIAAGSLMPASLITFAALIVQVINMPTGDPLDPGRYAKDQTPKSA